MYQSSTLDFKSKMAASAVFIDESSTLRAFAYLFETSGVAVEIYSPGEHGPLAKQSVRPGCFLIDATSAGSRRACLSLLGDLRQTANRITAIVVVDRSDISLAARAIRAGAYDVLDNRVDHAQLLSSVQLALGAIGPASPTPEATKTSGLKIDKAVAHAALATLTARQREILDRIILGQPNKIIAADLSIKLRTAENHRAAIMKKLGATSISGLIQIALAARIDPSRPVVGEPDGGRDSLEVGRLGQCPPCARPWAAPNVPTEQKSLIVRPPLDC